MVSAQPAAKARAIARTGAPVATPASANATGQLGAGVQRLEGGEARLGRVEMAQPLRQRAAHLLALLAQLARFARLTICQSFSAAMASRSSRRQASAARATTASSRRHQGVAELVGEPGEGRGLVADERRARPPLPALRNS